MIHIACNIDANFIQHCAVTLVSLFENNKRADICVHIVAPYLSEADQAILRNLATPYPELEIINELAAAKGKTARVAFRINPNVGAHTHANITTGLAENKFGISMEDMDKVIDMAGTLPHVKFVGLHFHIGSQILDMGDFVALCNRVNELQEKLYARQIIVEHINVGGGLGIDYAHPNRQAIPNFTEYFATYHKHLKLRPQQTLHFELGRAVVGQ